MRRSGNTIRVNAQLIDALDGTHVWADRYDGMAVDIFAVQDEFVEKIAQALAVNFSLEAKIEIANSQAKSLEAWEEFQKGWTFFNQRTVKGNERALEHLINASNLDSTFGRAHAAVTLTYTRMWDWMRQASGPMVGWDYAYTDPYLKRAREHPTSLMHVFLSRVHHFQGRKEEALEHAELAIAADPNEPEAHLRMAWVKMAVGELETGLKFAETALRLNPDGRYYEARGIAHYAMDDLKIASELLEEGLEVNRQNSPLLPLLASAYAHMGRRADAHATMLTWKPGLTQTQLENISWSHSLKWFVESPIVLDKIYDGIRIAILPVEVTVPSLTESLRQGGYLEHRLGLRSLAYFGAEAAPAVPELIEALTNEDLIEDAITVLGKIGPGAREAILALQAVPEDHLYKYYAEEALKKITAQ